MKQEKHNKLKVMTIFGTRPEIIRLSRLFAKLDQYVNHIMIHTGQSYDYEMDKIFFENLKIRQPDYFLEVKSETLGGQIAKIIEKSEEVLKKEMPDAVLILGDTNSSLAAIVAKRMKIPIFHMEAGNRCFDENVPEEINRRIIDHISNINLPYSENARLYLIQEGIYPGTIYVTGSPMAEIWEFYKKDIEQSQILKELNLEKNKYFLASIHREENVESKELLTKLIDALNAVAETYQMPIIMSTHPRTRARLEEYRLKAHELINFHKPLGYFDYNNLQLNAFCVLSDSGTIQEESSIMGFPAIQIRESSERPEAFDEGVLILSGMDKDIILQAIDITTKQVAASEKFNVPKNYQDTNVSSKVLRLIVGLAKIVKKRRTLLS
ncbi:MAG: UDP-N-acetylglucosamine 2-epimerase (non-hydrolyzing) [Candidatus Nealsonbacteria bacterium CG_4_10_14_3_um_filter_36_16]|uniref:UDP-N-acetylglucosamine 2-epimerase (Non-hydrolyzing) n=2 Tax=Parcubacteria group TaxID=1794811 RepID=A0A2M7MFG0_9BACT|nr:UDP-N-acetylglucosamine 2-epimerase (non-hydrolyzing) [Parcubacteria group bacterium]PIU99005.1 MAG: UDP-N-acetylglucosamine 2-epimerase (non-hydrolyzing) [Candidatus Wolfebacteria bacterium CG03_land_8_20_14_0_80_39_317]PIX88537.1 MAG: UDP-N-acetylglucosamine 2-epimerase (non-hydrolyzing) [Candidatus Nealsonbacteria bacterium CG_4_10_14_3_um_filter_36_16]